jgi:hypothetical protein
LKISFEQTLRKFCVRTKRRWSEHNEALEIIDEEWGAKCFLGFASSGFLLVLIFYKVKKNKKTGESARLSRKKRKFAEIRTNIKVKTY